MYPVFIILAEKHKKACLFLIFFKMDIISIW